MAYLLLAGALTACVIGFCLERRTDLAAPALRVFGPQLVFLTNLSLDAVGALLGLLWRSAQGKTGDKHAGLRAALLSILLVSAALWSYVWYFAPLPANLNGAVDAGGYCRQTTQDSCSAAAAVMLLHRQGIAADEAEMARLCLTRAGMGTSMLGLYRGLWVEASEHNLKPKLIFLTSPLRLRDLSAGAIISVGLKQGLPPDVEERMRGYGWEPGLRHAVMMMGVDPAGKWIDVADPSYGHEHWPLADFAYIWDGQALMLAP